ncbi:MAG: menaquinone-dependent protoporphyrinogen oxidase [Gaiellaceae bacterium]|jgi:menaquinone-dependent protoporphyrinogen oxidase|nr:menaquinone-dependent protoporphyrinogen oxidase [Gaiellaceae bacterium]
MTVLVASASKHGATHEIARAIADVLEAEGISTVLMPLDAVETLLPYDAFVLGSAIYMGRWLRDARHFVDTHADVLATHPTWLFSSGPVGAPPQGGRAEKFDDAWLLEATHAREHRVFAGRLVKRELGLGERALTGALRVPEGDFREWPEISTWATTIAGALYAQPVG